MLKEFDSVRDDAQGEKRPMNGLAWFITARKNLKFSVREVARLSQDKRGWRRPGDTKRALERPMNKLAWLTTARGGLTVLV